MTLRNLGQIATLLSEEIRANHSCHDDVDAFDAPSECHSDVHRGFVRRCVVLAADVERSTGYTAEELIAEFERRVSGYWLHKAQILEPLCIAAVEREKARDARKRLKSANQARLPGRSCSYGF